MECIFTRSRNRIQLLFTILYLSSFLNTVTTTTTHLMYVDPKFSSVSFFPRICGQVNTDTDAVFFNRTSSGHNLQDWFHKCSYGKTVFEPNENIIIRDAPIFGCTNATTTQYNWRWPTCTDNFTWDIYNTIVQYFRNTLQLSFNNHKRIAMFLPSGGRCSWSGLAMLNCPNPPCGTWMMGTDVMLMAHEFGHTMGLQHATSDDAEYGDSSDAMGSGNSLRCLNAVYSSQLGWSLPILVLNAQTQTQTQTQLHGRWIQYQLPPMQLNDTNHIRIDGVRWDGLLQWTSMFISFRARVGYDSGLLWLYDNKVSIHIVNAQGKSDLIAILDQGGFLNIPFRPSTLPRVIIERIERNRLAVIRVCLGGTILCGSPPPSPLSIKRPPPPSPLSIKRPPPPSPPRPSSRPPPPSPLSIKRPPPSPPRRICGCSTPTIMKWVQFKY